MSDKLTMRWSKRERDLVIGFPTKTDGHYVHHALCSGRYRYDGTHEVSFVAELERRGYDITTLRFSVSRKREVAS